MSEEKPIPPTEHAAQVQAAARAMREACAKHVEDIHQWGGQDYYCDSCKGGAIYPDRDDVSRDIRALPLPDDALSAMLAEARREAGGVVGEIASERRRQIEVEGWTPEHDDGHTSGELAIAACCYAMPAGRGSYADIGVRGHYHGLQTFQQHMWPWHSAWWKPKGRRQDLIRAAALIVAEIERLDRAAAEKGAG